MLYATNRFPGDGTTTQYEINFVGGYISPAHVKAYVEAPDQTTTPVTINPGSFIGPNTIIGFAPVPVGHTMVIYRDTPKEPIVDFTNTSRLTEANLDTATRQGAFIAVEALDRGISGSTGGGGSTPGDVEWANVLNKPIASATVAGLVKVGANLTIDSEGVLAASSGGGGGSTPEGPAGGVLSGSYPNPGFASPMATTADLSAGLEGKAPTSHTHSITDATVPGGTTPGQVPTFNGTSLVMQTPAAGGSSADPVVVYIGDSLGSDHPNLDASPAVHLERTLRAGGFACRVVNLSVNGFTFYKANTQAVFGSQTMVQRAIELAPVAVVTALGFNDTVMGVGGRTSAQVNSDAAAFFQSLRTGLPSAAIVAGLQLAYDMVNFTPATLKNRGVIPALMTLRSTGLLAGCWSSEILEDSVSAGTQTAYANYASLDTYIRGLATISAYITLDLWKIARLGLNSADGLHLTAFGSRLLGTTWRKAFNSVAALQAKAPNLRTLDYAPFDAFMNPDGTVETNGIWDLLMQASGTDWVAKTFTSTAQHPNHQGGPWTHCNPAAWFLPSKGAYKPSTLAYVTGTTFSWELRNVAPSTDIQASTDGAAYITIGQTTHYGDYLGSGILPISSAGTYVFRYKVGNEVHGPVSLVVTVGAVSGSWTPKVISGANLTSNVTNVAATYSRIPYDTTNYANSDAGYWSFTNPGGNERRLTLTPPGGGCWARFTFHVGCGAATTNVNVGIDFYDAAMVFLYRVIVGSGYDGGYSVSCGGSFTGKFNATTIAVPWMRSPGGGGLLSVVDGATAAYWSGEVLTV